MEQRIESNCFTTGASAWHLEYDYDVLNRLRQIRCRNEVGQELCFTLLTDAVGRMSKLKLELPEISGNLKAMWESKGVFYNKEGIIFDINILHYGDFLRFLVFLEENGIVGLPVTQILPNLGLPESALAEWAALKVIREEDQDAGAWLEQQKDKKHFFSVLWRISNELETEQYYKREIGLVEPYFSDKANREILIKDLINKPFQLRENLFILARASVWIERLLSLTEKFKQAENTPILDRKKLEQLQEGLTDFQQRLSQLFRGDSVKNRQVMLYHPPFSLSFIQQRVIIFLLQENQRISDEVSEIVFFQILLAYKVWETKHQNLTEKIGTLTAEIKSRKEQVESLQKKVRDLEFQKGALQAKNKLLMFQLSKQDPNAQRASSRPGTPLDSEDATMPGAAHSRPECRSM